MKNRMLRVLVFCLALVLLLQIGAFSAMAATKDEIIQYEHDLAVYNEWKAYREQEAAYYAYQEYLTNGVHQHEAYLQYASTVSDAIEKLKGLDYIFIRDSHGWALIESIDLGVAAVDRFVEDPENMKTYADYIAGLKTVLLEAKNSSSALKSIFSSYESIYYANHGSDYHALSADLAALNARYSFYKAKHASLVSNSRTLYKDLLSLYNNSYITPFITKKETEKGMEGRYLKLVTQLVVLFCCLNDAVQLPELDEPLLTGIPMSLGELLEPSQIATDSNKSNPATLTSLPAEAVSDVPAVEPVEKPTKPEEPEITVEPTKPAGYDTGDSGSGSGGEIGPGGGSSEDSGSGGGGSSGDSGSSGGGGGVTPPVSEPIQETDRSYTTERELKQNIAIAHASTIKDGDAEAILPIESERALLSAGVKSVAISLSEGEETEGDRITFSVSGGKLSEEDPLFRLLLTDGEAEDYRYAYFVKDGEDWNALTGTSADLSLSDEVLRRKSYYLRPSEEVDDENCNLKSLPISALPGETVKIAPQCTFGYEIVNLVVRTKDGEEILVDRQEFLMPYGAVTITFEVIKILYHVRFFFEGALVAERDYGLGEEIIPPELDVVPEKESDGEYQYTFVGWSLEQKTAVGEERELRAEAKFSKTLIRYEEELYDLRWAFLKPILLFVGVLLAIAAGIFFLIRRRKKKKKQAENKE